MKRVMIVGGPGSGKSVLARKLGARTGLPVIHIDRIHWQAGWVERSPQDKDRLCRDVHMQEEWIFEGGHSRTWAERIARADTYIWLDVPVHLRIFRVLRRSLVYYGRSRPDLPDGCPERLNRQTIGFLKFIWRTRNLARKKMEALYRDPPPHVTCHRFATLSQVRDFLDGLPDVALRKARQDQTDA